MRPVYKPLAVALVTAGFMSSAMAAYSGHHGRMGKTPARGCSAVVNHTANVNSPRSGVKSSSCWYNRVTVSGVASALFKSVHTKTTAESVTTSATNDSFDVNNVNLFVDAKMNRDVAAHLNVAYTDGDLNVDEAYVNYSNFAGSPVFLKFGKGYLDFGNYADPYAVAPSLSQMLAQNNETQLALGFASHAGMNASVFFYGHGLEGESKDRINKFGARFGYNGRFDSVNYKFNASFINDTRATTGHAMLADTYVNSGYLGTISDTKRKAMYDVNLGLDYMNFDLGFDYLSASGDLKADSDSKPGVFGVAAGYNFDMGGYKSRVGGSYEKANNSGKDVFKAKSRWSVGYSVSLSPNVDLGIDYATYKQHAAGNKQRFVLVGLKSHM